MALTKQQVLDMAKTTDNKDNIDVLLQSNISEINKNLLCNPNLSTNQFFRLVKLVDITEYYKNNENEIHNHIIKYSTDKYANLVNIYISYFSHIFTNDEITQMLLNIEENCIPIIIKNKLNPKINKALYVQYILKYFLDNSLSSYSSKDTEWLLSLDKDILDEVYKSNNIELISTILKIIDINTLSTEEIKLLYDKQNGTILKIINPVLNKITINSIDPKDILENIRRYFIDHDETIDIDKEIINLKTNYKAFDKDFYNSIFEVLLNSGYNSKETSVMYTIWDIIPIDILVSLDIEIPGYECPFDRLSWENMTIEDFNKLLQKFPNSISSLYTNYIDKTNNKEIKELLINEALTNDNIKLYNYCLTNISAELAIQFIVKDNSYYDIFDYYRWKDTDDNSFEYDLTTIYNNKDKLDSVVLGKIIYYLIEYGIKFHKNYISSPLLINLFNEFGSAFSIAQSNEAKNFINTNIAKLNKTVLIYQFNLYKRHKNINGLLYFLDNENCPLEILEYFNNCSGTGANKIKQTIRNNPVYIAAHTTESIEKDNIDDVRSIIEIAITRGIIKQSDKDDLGIVRDDNTIKDIWKSLVDQDFISNKQQKYVDLAKRSIE